MNPVAAPSQGSGSLQQAGFASSEQFLNTYKELDAGLTIQTREGDIVTLSANSLSQFSAYEYNSQGIVETDDGMASVNSHVREISLYTEETFAFSVQGDLSEEELADIEAIVKGIDSVIGEMASGDMAGAIEEALSIGSFDSISMYQADITLARGYAYAEATQAQGYASLPQAPAPEATEPEAGAIHVPTLVEKMAEMLEEKKAETVARAAQPLESLFDHHMENLEDEEEEDTPMYQALQTAKEAMANRINEMVRNAFKDYLDELA